MGLAFRACDSAIEACGARQTLNCKLCAVTLAKLKEKVENETLDTAGLRIKFAEEAR